MSQKPAISALKVAYVLPLIEAFLAKHAEDFNATSLGKKAVGDPNKIHEMRNGTQVRGATAEKIIAVIDAHAPGFSERFVKKHARDNIYDE